jgi:WS/DGAT/MGAT family acyltransferase
LVDGVSGVDVAAVLLDVTPETRRQPPSTWRPSAPEPAPVALVRGLSRRAGDLVAVAGGASAALVHPSRLAANARRIAEVVTSLRTDGLAPRSSLNVPTGTGRRLAWVRTHLADVKAAGADTGATANDVVLTAVAGGVRTALLARGEVVAHEQTISVLVPVSVRRPDERGSLGNRVSALVLPLPIGLGDPAARLDATMNTMRRLKAEHGAEASETLVGALDLLPPVAIRLLAPVVHRQPLINLVVTNVPGSAAPLYMLGARMLEVFPIVPLVGNLSVGVAVLSYDGALNLGLTADTATCADLDVLIGGIERCFRDLGAMSAVPAPVSAP